MELLNGTDMVAEYTLGLDPQGREHLVAVVKGTFDLAGNGGVPTLAAAQEPIVKADVFTGEPGLSATVYESEFSYLKRFCDVILNGSAHAPGGRPTDRVTVGLRVGSMSKSFNVVGDRYWTFGGAAPTPSRAQPFTTLPVSYDRAFGGTSGSPDDPASRVTYAPNPVGVGYHRSSADLRELEGRPLPNTEEITAPIESPSFSYAPMSFGAIGRNFAHRVALAGTYDQRWIDEVCPFLPSDFDPLYFQCAPPDQLIEHPRGGEPVVLVNLTPGGRLAFELPSIDMRVEFTDQRCARSERVATLDTIVIEPDAGRLLMTWRASLPLKRSIFEVAQVVVGRMSPGWYRARETGKTYLTRSGDKTRPRPRGARGV